MSEPTPYAPVTPSGIESKPLGLLADMLADCESLQAWCGVTDEDLGTPEGVAAARTHVHVPLMLDAPQDTATEDAAAFRKRRSDLRPVFVVGLGDSLSGQRQAEADGYFHHEGGMSLIVEDVVAAPADGVGEAQAQADALMIFANNVGAVMEEIESLSGESGHILVIGWRRKFGPARMLDEQVDKGELDVYQVQYDVEHAET